MTFHDSWTFAPVGGATRVKYLAEAETHGLFKLADPIVARIVKKQWDGNLEALKEILEERAPAAVTR